MCIFDELGILLCSRIAENCVFANRLSDLVAVISFHSVSLLTAECRLVRRVLKKPHLVVARGFVCFCLPSIR